MRPSMILISIAAFFAAPAIAAPNDSRSGVPSDTGTSIDIMMDSHATPKGAPKNPSDQAATSTETTEPKIKPKTLPVVMEGEEGR